MKSKLAIWCDSFIEAGWLAAIVAVPLFFNIHSDRVFEPDKLAILRSLAVLMSAVWLVKFVDQQGWRTKWWRMDNDRSIWHVPLVWPVFLLVLVYLVSTAFSVTPRVSWAGSYQRLQGTYTTFSYIVVFALMLVTIRSREQVRRVVTAVIITSIPVSFYGLLQHFDLDPLPWAGNITERVAGHMGNAIFIAAYLIMAVPLTLSRIIEAFTSILSDEEMAGADVIRSSIYIFTLAIQLITIYWSGSRGPWLGLGVGLFAFVLVVLVALRNSAQDKRRFHLADAAWALLLVIAGWLVAFWVVNGGVSLLVRAGRAPSLAGPMASFISFALAVVLLVIVIFIMIALRRGWRWLWLSWIFMSLLLGGWLVVFNLPPALVTPYEEVPVVGSVVQTLEEWRDLPRIGRFGRILEADTGTGRVRTLIWQGVIELIMPHEPLKYPDGRSDAFNFLRPFVGYGPEAMYVAYNPFYPPELATLESRNASPDRSHNETFDAIVITGLFGLLVWQALYVGVFYYSFRWLGVLRTRFERNLLIGLWIGMGVLVAAIFATWRGLEYVGVALPFGSIGGLVVYLIYYALFAPMPEDEVEPFEPNRLLLVGLVSAVLAHYVEIHFGIAIAATRLHFFAFIALIVVLGHILPGLPALEVEPAPASRRRRGRRTAVATATYWGPVLLMTALLTLAIGIIGYEFTTYAQPPDKVIQSAADLTTSEIFRQSFFVNARRGFVDSPFVYLMLVLTWALGTLLILSELVKDKILTITAVSRVLPSSRKQMVMVLLGIMGGVSLLLRFATPGTGTATTLLGRSLWLIWGVLCLWAAARLLVDEQNGRLVAAGVGLTGILFTLPVLVAGGSITMIITAVVCLAILYFTWDTNWSSWLIPAVVTGFISFSIGLIYTLTQASLLRASFFFVPPAQIQDIILIRVLEASQAAGFLSVFYAFMITLILVGSVALAWQYWPQTRLTGHSLAMGGLAALFIVALVIIATTNMRIIQADMVYKRGKPFDDQATRTGNPQAWDIAIGIYDKAIEMAPKEDFYYLFLGRAYLERATLAQTPEERDDLLEQAMSRLLEAQRINPLNTDHTANLARLNTRWAELSAEPSVRREHVNLADQYYQAALQLSPNNAVIRNEYARLVQVLENDCDRAIQMYKDSLGVDPYYSLTYFALADAYVACSADQPEEARISAYRQAVSYAKEGLLRDERNARAWLQVGQLYQQLGEYESALNAYEQVQVYDVNGQIPAWNLDFLMATAYLQLGNVQMAKQLAEQALAVAPPQAAEQIQAFLAQVDASQQ